jgi:hypothetical protein
MLFVYWLGADLGVLLLARESKRRDLTVAERGFALRMALVIDFLPRIAFALMLPVGLAVTASGGFEIVPLWAHALAWAVALGWIALLLALSRSQGQPRAVTLNQWHLAIQGALMLVLGGIAILSLSSGMPFANAWLATKLLLYAAIFGLGLGIDAAFRPVAPAFLRIATQGGQDADEAVFSRGIDLAIRYVLALYAALIVIALLGVTKPF